MKKIFSLTISIIFLFLTLPTYVFATDWPMAGANPQRTSWTSETLPDVISAQWVKPIYPLVPQKVQVIGAEGKVYVSTSAGLYAFDATTGADSWQYATALPLGHSPTYNIEGGIGYLYVGGLDKKIHKIRASTGQAMWTTAQAGGGYVTNPIVANSKVYVTNRDGALYAFNISDGSQAWKFQTGNQINQSPAFMAENDGIGSTTQGSLYFVSNDGYGYAVDAATGTQIWQSDADSTTSIKDKFPSQGFYSWWPVIYGQDVIFMNTGFYYQNGAESAWLFGTSPNPAKFAGTISYETQSGYWPVGEKILDIRTNPNGYTFPDYYETQLSGDNRPQHGPFRRNAYFVNRTSGLERQFDLDNDGLTDAAPISWQGDGGTHPPPSVSGYNNVLYFASSIRARDASFNSMSIFGWKVGTPYVSVTMDKYHSSDEPMGISAAGDKVYYNHCCDREIAGVNISRPNTDNINEPAREWSYFSGGGLDYFSWPLSVNGLPNSQSNYYYNEATKYFWDPQPNLSPPCCAAVFWNENDKVGPSVYNGRMYAILGNSLVAFSGNGTGASAPRLSSAPSISPASITTSITDSQIRSRLESEVTKIIQAGHLMPSYLHAGNITGSNFSRGIDEYLGNYWHNPSETFVILLRALPYLTSTLQNQVKTYLQTEMVNYNPALVDHVGFATGTKRDPWPYPPLETVTRLFNPPQASTGSTSFDGWGFAPSNVYALWKYAQAGLGNPSTLLTQWGTRLKVPIGQNSTTLTDTYLIDHPLILNAYISAYKGYFELAKLAGQTSSQYGPFESEYNRLLSFRVANLTTFPNSVNSAASSYRNYYTSLITYYNFAYMTPELADYLRTNARSSNPDKDILAILQKYQDIAPYWMQVHNGETQGESAIQPYQQTHSLFQGLALVKKAPKEELTKYLDTPIVPVGDLYYIDNLVATLEASGTLPTSSITTPTTTVAPLPGDINGDRVVNILDYTLLSNSFGTNNSASDLNRDGSVNILDFTILSNNYGSHS